MCLVVAYQRLKTIENSKTVNRKSGRSQLRQVAVYERFQYKALTENIFGVLGRWSLMGGGRPQDAIAHRRWLPTGGGRPQEAVAGGGSTVLTEKVLSFLRKLHKHLVSQMKRKWACTKSVLPACTGVTQSSNRGPERSRLRWLTRRVGVHSLVASAAIIKLLFSVKLLWLET